MRGGGVAKAFRLPLLSPPYDRPTLMGEAANGRRRAAAEDEEFDDDEEEEEEEEEEADLRHMSVIFLVPTLLSRPRGG